MRRSKSSKSWLKEHFDDPYVKRAQSEGYRSRAVYKLKELDARDALLRPGQRVIDLGAAPGGWAQYASERVGKGGLVVALDILPMTSLAGVEVMQGDFTEQTVLEAVIARMAGHRADLVMSDMAPNISGVDVSDQARAMYLAELALDFARQVLRPGGDFIVKVFQGAGYAEFHRALRKDLMRVLSRKPEASRPRSKEMYLVGMGFRVADAEAQQAPP